MNARRLGLLLAAGLLLASPPALGVDVTDVTTVNRGRPLFDFAMLQNRVALSVRNDGEHTLVGPIDIVISGISAPSVTIADPDGTTPTGEPFVRLADNTLTPGAVSETLTLILDNPARARFSFSTAVHAAALDGSTGTNTAPIADPGPDRSVARNVLVELDGSASTDTDGDPLTYRWSLTSQPPGAGVVLSAADSALATFTTSLPGDYVVELVVNDGEADSAPATAVIATVNAIETGTSVLVVHEDLLATIDVLSIASDADGDVLSATVAVAPAHGVLQFLNASLVEYRPDPDFNGSDAFVLSITDGFDTVAGEVDVIVTPVNDAPTLERVGVFGPIRAGEPFDLSWTVNDVDGDVIIAAPLETVTGFDCVLVRESGLIELEIHCDPEFLPPADEVSFTVTVVDNGMPPLSASDTVTLEILASTDGDSDGIADTVDRCPESPSGMPVNGDGCFDTVIVAEIGTGYCNQGAGACALTTPPSYACTDCAFDFVDGRTSDCFGTGSLLVTSETNIVLNGCDSLASEYIALDCGSACEFTLDGPGQCIGDEGSCGVSSLETGEVQTCVASCTVLFSPFTQGISRDALIVLSKETRNASDPTAPPPDGRFVFVPQDEGFTSAEIVTSGGVGTSAIHIYVDDTLPATGLPIVEEFQPGWELRGVDGCEGVRLGGTLDSSAGFIVGGSASPIEFPSVIHCTFINERHAPSGPRPAGTREGIERIERAPEGMFNLAEQHVFIAAANGMVMLEPESGNVPAVPVQPEFNFADLFGALGFVNFLTDNKDEILMYGAGGSILATRQPSSGTFTFFFRNFVPNTDAAYIDNDPDSGRALVTSDLGIDAVGMLEVPFAGDASVSEVFNQGRRAVDRSRIADADGPVSAFAYTEPDPLDLTAHYVVGITRGVPDAGQPGRAFVAQAFSDEPVTEFVTLGLGPQQIRCAHPLCFAFNFLDNNISTLRWSGGDTLESLGIVPVGAGPTGGDARVRPDGTIEVVTPGFADDSITYLRFDPSGALLESITNPVVSGCLQPSDAKFMASGPTFLAGTDAHVLMGCNASGTYTW